MRRQLADLREEGLETDASLLLDWSPLFPLETGVLFLNNKT